MRAKVNALEARSASGTKEATAARMRHNRLVQEAQYALGPGSPRLVLMSGLSGSGKTWLAAQLAPVLNAIHLRSDVERKRLAGLNAKASSGSATGEELYTAQVHRGCLRASGSLR